MIVVKIELWSAITGKVSELGRMYIANVGKHPKHPEKGNYEAKVCRKGSFETETWDSIKTTRTGSVKDYPRQSYNVWRLIIRALKDAFPEEDK